MQQDQQKYLDYILENSDIFMERGYALPVENQLYSQVYVKKGVYLPPDCETPPVMHDSLEIIQVTQGKIHLFLDGDMHVVSEGQLGVVNCEVIHYLMKQKEEARYNCIFLQYLFCKEEGADIAVVSIEPIIDDAYLTDLCNHIMDEYKEKPIGYKCAMRSYARLLLANLFRKHMICPEVESDRDLPAHYSISKLAMRYMRKNYLKNFSVSQMSRDLAISAAYLCRCFRKTVNIKPIEYINYLRCNTAGYYIINKQNTIKEAALNCGFNNLSYFSRTFKKIMGILPSELAAFSNSISDNF